MNALRLMIALTMLFGTTRIVGAQEEETRSLTLVDCIQQALDDNLRLRISRIGPIVAQNNLSLAYAGYDPEMNFSGQHAFRRTGGGFDSDQRLIPASESDTDGFASGLGGLLPWGMTYDVSASAQDTVFSRDIITNSATIETSSGTLEGTLTQPLLRNAWIDGTRLSIAISRSELAQSKEQHRMEIINVVTEVELAYYDLAAAMENVKVQETGLQLAKRLLEENRKRVEVGALAPLDESQAESEVAAREADLVSARQQVGTRENRLRRLITDDYGKWQSVQLIPVDVLTAVPQLLDVQDSWDKGLTMRPEIVQAWLVADEYQVRLKYSRNQLYPQLDAFGTYGLAGTDVKEFSGVFGRWQDGGQPFWRLGARLSIPLSNARARAEHRNTREAAERVQLEYKDLEQAIMSEIDDAIKVARGSYRRVDATRAARKYAEAALAAEEEKLANGKSTSFEVLRLQRDLTQARSSEISALTEYNKSLAVLAQSEGSTLQRRRIDFEEY